MSTDLSSHSEQFIESAIARGLFHTRGEALEEAVELLRRRQELCDKVETGTQQLRSGQFTTYDDRSLLEFRDQMKADGLKRRQDGETA